MTNFSSEILFLIFIIESFSSNTLVRMEDCSIVDLLGCSWRTAEVKWLVSYNIILS